MASSLRSLNGKTSGERPTQRPLAVVTGGTSRIGVAICDAVASKGYDVALLFYTAREKAVRLVDQLCKRYGTRNTCHAVDLRVRAKVQSTFSRVIKTHGRIDLLVNNASLFAPTHFPFRADHLTKWRDVFDATFWGSLYCCNSALPFMARQSRGHIINIADVYADLPLSGYGAYCIAKSAILGLTRQLAVECAPRIRANAVNLGPITPPVGKEHTSRAHRLTLLHRWGGPNSVANAVLYLDANPFVTGEILTVDGGKRYVGAHR